MIRQLFALCLVTGLLAAVGCGGGMATVECLVTLDNTPVDKATVMFVPDDKAGGQSASGLTDSSGRCVMMTGNKSGVKAGKYKISVTKTPGVTGADPEKMKDPSSPDAMKMMMKNMSKTGEGGAGPMGGAPGMGGPGPGTKSELPAKYASTETSGFTATVPVSGQVKLELKK